MKRVFKSWSDTVAAYAGNPNECFKTGSVLTSVFSRDGVLYSYGEHWPLALAWKQADDGTWLFVKNGDGGRSVTTSAHTGCVQRYCEGPTVSLSGFEAALGGQYYTLANLGKMIVDYRKDERFTVTFDGKVWRGADKEVPPAGQLLYIDYREDCDQHTSARKGDAGQWHVAGAVVVKVVQPGLPDKYLLGGVDESIYFVCELPKAVSTVAEAFESLKPPFVTESERKGATVVRQGDWFFVKQFEDDGEMVKYLFKSKLQLETAIAACRDKTYRGYVLKSEADADDASQHRHVAARGFYGAGGDNQWVSGMVRHTGRKWLSGAGDVPDNGRGEHRAVRLGQGWWLAVQNTAKRSWAANGKID